MIVIGCLGIVPIIYLDICPDYYSPGMKGWDNKCFTLMNYIKHLADDNSTVNALQDINMHIKPNEFAVIVGPSGCGKTTL